MGQNVEVPNGPVDGATANRIFRDIYQAQNQLLDTLGTMLPPGIMVAYAGSSEPKGWLLVGTTNPGREVDRATYSKLFAVIGTEYGDGDGSTTFNLPSADFFRNGAFNEAGNSGGASTHSHNATGHATNSTVGRKTDTGLNTPGAGHTHNVDIGNASHIPPFTKYPHLIKT